MLASLIEVLAIEPTLTQFSASSSAKYSKWWQQEHRQLPSSTHRSTKTVMRHGLTQVHSFRTQFIPSRDFTKTPWQIPTSNDIRETPTNGTSIPWVRLWPALELLTRASPILQRVRVQSETEPGATNCVRNQKSRFHFFFATSLFAGNFIIHARLYCAVWCSMNPFFCSIHEYTELCS